MNDAEQLHNLNLACKEKPLFAGRVWAPQYFKNKFASFHYDMINRIQNRPKDVNIIVIECMRGAAKTLLISELLTTHDSVYNGLKFTVITSYADDAAQRIISRCSDFLKSEKFSIMFPNAKMIKDRKQLIEMSCDGEHPFDFQILSRGRNSQKTGLRYKENRIGRFIGDDMENPEEAYSIDIVDQNVRYIDEVVEPAMEPGAPIILIGTPFAHDCVTRRISRRRHGVMTLRYPILVDDRIGGVFHGDDRVGKPMSEMLGIAEGNSIWDDRFPTDKVLKTRDEKIDNGISAYGSWLRQFMLDPRPPGSVGFDLDKVNYFSPNDIDKKMNVFLLCDFAYSKQVWADDSAIVVIGVDQQNNFYVLYAEKDKWGDTGTTDKIFEVAQRFKDNLKVVGVETRSFGFVQKRLIEEKRRTGINFGLIELKPGNRTKPERIKAMTSVLEDGRLFMVRGLRKLEDEMYKFRGEDMRRGDDLMDAMAYILDIAYKPEIIKTQQDLDNEENHRIWASINKEYDERKKHHDDVENLRGVHESYRDIERFY